MPAPNLVNPQVYPIDPNHPDVALATINRFLLSFVSSFDDTTVSMDDLRLVVAVLTKLSTDYQGALQASLADRQKLRADLDALTARVAALEKRPPVLAQGHVDDQSAVLTAGGSTRTISVPFDVAAPSTSYLPVALLDVVGGALLPEALMVTGFPSRTKDGVTVAVKNTALLSLSTRLRVTVLAFAVG